MSDADLRPILFTCEEGDHLVSRGEAERRDGELVCPRHYAPDTAQQSLGSVSNQ